MCTYPGSLQFLPDHPNYPPLPTSLTKWTLTVILSNNCGICRGPTLLQDLISGLQITKTRCYLCAGEVTPICYNLGQVTSTEAPQVLEYVPRLQIDALSQLWKGWGQ